MKMSPIRQRFVPALIIHDFLSAYRRRSV